MNDLKTFPPNHRELFRVLEPELKELLFKQWAAKQNPKWHPETGEIIDTPNFKSLKDFEQYLDGGGTNLVKEAIRKRLRESLLIEPIKKKYNAWVMPSDKMLAQEYKVEHEFKGKKIWESLKDFIDAVKNSDIVEVDETMDNKIYYRSRTKTFDSLHNLIKRYRSYPEFKNEDTLKNLYTRIQNNKPLDYPIVLKYKDGNMIIFSGNTRMDVAFQMGINPKVLMVEI